jgi:hypothetical protein
MMPSSFWAECSGPIEHDAHETAKSARIG